MGFRTQGYHDRAALGDRVVGAWNTEGYTAWSTGLAEALGTLGSSSTRLEKKVLGQRGALMPWKTRAAPGVYTDLGGGSGASGPIDHDVGRAGLWYAAADRREPWDHLLGVEPSVGYVNEVLDRACKGAAEFGERAGLAAGQRPGGRRRAVQRGGRPPGGGGASVVADPVPRAGKAGGRSRLARGPCWTSEHGGPVGTGGQRWRRGPDGGDSQVGGSGSEPGPMARPAPRRANARVLEKAAYKAMGREEELAKKARGCWIRAPDGQEMCAGYREAQADVVLQIDRYEAVRTLGRWVKEALDPVDPPTGRLRDAEGSAGRSAGRDGADAGTGGEGGEEAGGLPGQGGPGLLAYVRKLAAAGGRLVEELGEEPVRIPVSGMATGARRRRGGQKAAGQKAYPASPSPLPAPVGPRQYTEARGKVADAGGCDDPSLEPGGVRQLLAAPLRRVVQGARGEASSRSSSCSATATSFSAANGQAVRPSNWPASRRQRGTGWTGSASTQTSRRFGSEPSAHCPKQHELLPDLPSLVNHPRQPALLVLGAVAPELIIVLVFIPLCHHILVAALDDGGREN